MALKAALDVKDRKAIGAAAGKMEAAAKEVKDKDFQKKAAKVATDIKGDAGATVGKVFSGDNLMKALYLFIGFAILGVIGMAFMGLPVGRFMAGFPIVFILSALAYFVSENDIVKYYGLEVVFWSLIFGLLISNSVGVPAWLKSAIKTEYFIKIGLVLLGAEVLFGTIAKVGAYGMVQSILVIGVVFYFCIWFARKVGLDDEFAAILGSAVSICGVSAAIAAGGAVQGDSKKVSHTISLVLLCAIPMLILMPLFAKWVGMSPAVAGAWLGGTIDTTGAVVAAGAIAGPEAMSVAVVVKMAQNVLIGLAAFLLALWFAFKGQAAGGEAEPDADLDPFSQVRPPGSSSPPSFSPFSCRKPRRNPLRASRRGSGAGGSRSRSSASVWRPNSANSLQWAAENRPLCFSPLRRSTSS